MHIRDQRNSNNFHGYKKIDLVINSKFIGSQQTHRKKAYIVWSPREHCINNQEREREREGGSHLATKYGPVVLQSEGNMP